MSPTHETMHELSGLYVLGALAPADATEFEAHLATCEICRAEVSALRPVAGALPGTVAQVDPPALLRGRVLESITGQSTSSHARLHARAPIAPWLAAAALLAAVALGGYAVQLRGRITNLEGELQQATAQVALADRQVVDARRTALDAQFQVAVLAAPDLLRIDLGGLPPAPTASARAFWSRSRGMVFTASNLPPLMPGRVYQLWVIPPDQGNPISVGLLEPDASGTLTRVFQTPADLPPPTAVAVSEEPAGGVPQPTGQLYLAGKPA